LLFLCKRYERQEDAGTDVPPRTASMQRKIVDDWVLMEALGVFQQVWSRPEHSRLGGQIS
jgi:hypothetical protein